MKLIISLQHENVHSRRERSSLLTLSGMHFICFGRTIFKTFPQVPRRCKIRRSESQLHGK